MAPVRPRRALLLLPLLVLAPLAGCLGGDGEPLDSETPAGTTDAGGATAPTAQAGADVDAALMADAALDLPITQTLYFDPAGGLVPVAGEASAVPMGGSYAKCFATPPCHFVSFTSAPFARDTILPPQTVKVTLHLEAAGPVAPGAFGVAAWLGSPLGMALYRIVDVSVLAPGVHTVEVDLELQRPLVIPAGQPLQIYSLAGNVHENTGLLQLLMGGEAASAVTFLAGPVQLAAIASSGQPETFTGKLAVPGFPAGTVVPEEHREASHAFTVSPNATRLLVTLRMSAGPRAGDLDLDVLKGGEPVMGSHTPLDTESVFLAGPALADLRGQELTVRVSNFWAPDATYEVIVTQT